MLGEYAQAEAPLARTLKLVDGKAGDPALRAKAGFDLAQALWVTGHDRARAVALGREAAAALEKAPERREDLASVKAWLERVGGKPQTPLGSGGAKP
jgi:hypothetical protein